MRFALKLVAFVVTCFLGSAALAQDDKVRIKGIDPGEEVVVAMSARKAPGKGCFDGGDESKWIVQRADAAGEVTVGKNLASGCVLTVAAFSRDRAMLLQSLSGWKNQGGEVKTVTMKPPIEVPIVVWITDKSLEGVARRSADRAAEIYR